MCELELVFYVFYLVSIYFFGFIVGSSRREISHQLGATKGASVSQSFFRVCSFLGAQLEPSPQNVHNSPVVNGSGFCTHRSEIRIYTALAIASQ